MKRIGCVAMVMLTIGVAVSGCNTKEAIDTTIGTKEDQLISVTELLALESVQKVSTITEMNFTLEDLADLKMAKVDLKEAQKDSAYSEAQKEVIKAEWNRVNEIIKAIENVQRAKQYIEKLPDNLVAGKENHRNVVELAQTAYAVLSDYGKTFITESQKALLEQMVFAITDYQVTKIQIDPLDLHAELVERDSWAKKCGVYMIFTVNGVHSKFKGVEIDSYAITTNHDTYYSMEKDSTVIYMSCIYLNRLALGEHTFTAIFEDGEASVTFMVQEEEPVEEVDSPYYRYPVVPGTEEWVALWTVADKIEACRIPEDVLKNLTDEQLIQATLDCPFIVDLYVYNDVKTGVESLEVISDAYAELLRRETAKDSLIAFIKEHCVSNGEELTVEKELQNDNLVVLLMYQEEWKEQLTEEDLAVIESIR